MTDLRWQRVIRSRRLSITWPEGVRVHDGARAASISERQALQLLKAIDIGHDPVGQAQGLEIESLQLTYSKTTASFVGPPTREPRWRLSIVVGLNANTDASFFRRPLDGLPPECFRGF